MSAFQPLLLLAQVTAELDPSAPAEPEHSWFLANLVFGALTILALLVAIYLAYRARHGMDWLVGQSREAEDEFERTMAELADMAAPDAAPPAPPDDPPVEPVSRTWSPPPPVVPTVPPPPDAPIGIYPVTEMARRLQSLRILNDLEGRVPLPVPPEGEIYGLRRGGTCLILPRLESAELMTYFCRRFEMVIVVGASGDPLILDRFQRRLPELIDTPGMPKKPT